MIEQAHEAQPLGPGNELVHGQQASVRPLDPHQAFVEGGPARAGIDDRLEQDEDPTLVERGEDFVGRPHVLLALGDRA